MAADARGGTGLSALPPDDTIVALSSGAPPAAIAVVRVSGPAAFTAVQELAGTLPPPRRAGLRTLRQGDEVIDRALVLVFPGPASATGEDLVELHCHGGRAVVGAVEAALLIAPGVRRAAPGEFTRRALASGRIDLAEAEGLADLLAAETQAQRRAAWAGAGGRLSTLVQDWMARLAVITAELELAIDHDEDAGDAEAFRTALLALATEWQTALAAPPVERLRDGIRVVLAGPPNAGKSTLINALAERDVAIVSPVAGTTRDRLEAPVARSGVAYLLVDTAGLTATVDPVEAIGVARANEAVQAADLVLWLGDGPEPPGAIRVHAKADLSDRRPSSAASVAVSARTGDGIGALWECIAGRAAALLPRDDTISLNGRQRGLLAEAADELAAVTRERDLLIVAEQGRRARSLLGSLLGLDATEAMLDALFGRFCLGK